ncbi:alpha/beta hydrolase [Mycolicibacterium sp. HK-90]|nr:alpha/beta hydrolase [Mycolicibacterium sp. HK-90]WKG03956.1 alpha/beta hydrolase [Mycolicibacterium sp. HK-90]
MRDQSEVPVIGHGPRRVLISHGWIGDSRIFDPIIEHVDRDEFTLAMLDHRGYGRRSNYADGIDIDTSAADLTAAANALGWDRFAIIGHSMGGMAAQRVAVDHPGRLSAMVLVAPVPAGGAQMEPAMLQKRLDDVQHLDRRRANVDTNSQHRATAEAIWRIHAEVNSDVLAAYLSSWGTMDFSSQLDGSAVPTLVLWGADDPAIPRELIERTLARWLTDVELDTLPTGHYPMVQAPSAFWARCATFLQATPGGIP